MHGCNLETITERQDISGMMVVIRLFCELLAYYLSLVPNTLVIIVIIATKSWLL